MGRMDNVHHYEVTLIGDFSDNMKLKLRSCDEGGHEISFDTIGWISLYRGYRIQISETEDGIRDLGSSPVIPTYYENFISLVGDDAYYDTINPVIKGQVLMAISEWLRNRSGREMTQGKGAILFPTIRDQRMLDAFVACCIDAAGLRSKENAKFFPGTFAEGVT